MNETYRLKNQIFHPK